MSPVDPFLVPNDPRSRCPSFSRMVLVFSSHLQPHGPNSLAAVRFSCPVRVYRLRIFPNGAPLFENARHMRSVTSPDAFYLDVFFNAQSVRGDGKDRQRPANALVPTSISYAGGLMDFAVDMGSEYATRLVIVKGSFERLSLAIYGHVVNESPPMREPKPIVPLEPEPLAPHLDPAHAPDPTALAKSLLELIPNAPSLPLAIRLVFCLKPTLDDWDIPGFPHIYASLDNDTEDYDLDSIVANLDRPIPEDFTQDTLDRFVERLTDFVGFPVCLLVAFPSVHSCRPSRWTKHIKLPTYSISLLHRVRYFLKLYWYVNAISSLHTIHSSPERTRLLVHIHLRNSF